VEDSFAETSQEAVRCPMLNELLSMHGLLLEESRRRAAGQKSEARYEMLVESTDDELSLRGRSLLF